MTSPKKKTAKKWFKRFAVLSFVVAIILTVCILPCSAFAVGDEELYSAYSTTPFTNCARRVRYFSDGVENSTRWVYDVPISVHNNSGSFETTIMPNNYLSLDGVEFAPGYTYSTRMLTDWFTADEYKGDEIIFHNNVTYMNDGNFVDYDEYALELALKAPYVIIDAYGKDGSQNDLSENRNRYVFGLSTPYTRLKRVQISVWYDVLIPTTTQMELNGENYAIVEWKKNQSIEIVYDSAVDNSDFHNVYLFSDEYINYDDPEILEAVGQASYAGVYKGIMISNLSISARYVSDIRKGYESFSFFYTQPYADPAQGIANYDIEQYLGNYSYRVPVESVSLSDISVVDWVITQANGVLALEIFPNVTLGGILWVVIGLSLVFVVMKLFLGG